MIIRPEIRLVLVSIDSAVNTFFWSPHHLSAQWVSKYHIPARPVHIAPQLHILGLLGTDIITQIYFMVCSGYKYPLSGDRAARYIPQNHLITIVNAMDISPHLIWLWGEDARRAVIVLQKGLPIFVGLLREGLLVHLYRIKARKSLVCLADSPDRVIFHHILSQALCTEDVYI